MRWTFFLREALRGLRRSSAPALAALLTVLLTAVVLGVFIPIVQATTGTATVRVLAPGTFILGIKYKLSSLAGIAVGKSPPTVVYTFGRVGAGTTASITIRPKK